MAAPAQLVQVAFAGGIDESQRPEVLDPSAAFTTIENCRQEARGGFSKRLGFASLASTRIDGTTRSTGDRIFMHGEQIGVLSGAQIDSYSSTAATWAPRSRVPECILTRRKLVAAPDAASASTSITLDTNLVYVNGYYVVAYAERESGTGSIVAHVVDASTGTVVWAQKLATGLGTDSIEIRVVASGNNVVALYRDGPGSADIVGARLSAANAASIALGFDAGVVVVSTAKTSPGNSWDACGLTSSVAITWANNVGGTTRVTTRRIDPTTDLLTTLTSANSTTLSAQITCVACDGDESDILWVAFTHSTSTNVYVEGLNPTTLAVTSTQAAVFTSTSNSPGNIGLGRTATAEGYIAFTSTATLSNGPRDLQIGRFTNAAGTTTASGSAALFSNWHPLGRPFTQGGRVYMEFAYTTSGTAVCLFDVTTPDTYKSLRPIAWGTPRLQAARRAGDNMPARQTSRVSSTKVASLQLIKSSSINGFSSAAEYDFAAKRCKTTAFARETVLQAGVPYVYDGQQAHELGFLVPPVLTSSFTATGLTGTYAYTAIYEYVDAAGNVHWSDTADAISVSPSNQTVNIFVGNCSGTWKDGADSPREPAELHRVRIRIYRTTNGGSTFYLLTTIISLPGTSVYTFPDNTADNQITGNAQCYRQPGTVGTSLGRQCPPGFIDQCEYNGMLVGIEGENVWHSAGHVIGEAPWFNEVWQYPVSGEGDNTAIAAQDGTLFVFKRRAIFALAGEAPSDNGSSGGLGAPRRLAVDVGCIDPRSIVVTSLGIFFQSERGIELLTRAQSVEHIGEQIQSTLASYPIISAATLDTRNSLVRFSLAASESGGFVSGNGVDLVLDLTLKLWVSRDTHASNTPAQASAMVLVGGTWRYAWLTAAGVVHYEKLSSDATAYLDATSTWITMKAETAWFKSGGIQGRQHLNRVLVLGKRSSAHGLSVSLAYDYNTTYQSPRAFTETEITTISAALPNEQVMHLSHDEAPCQAVRVKLQDSAPVTPGTGNGATWIGLTLDVTPQPGAYELPDTAA